MEHDRADVQDPLREQDVVKTYRYLRIGMIGAVVLLAASIGLERSKVDCWQTSISAYYYTPVRAIFVGCLMAVGLSLIVYKGRSLERPRFNFEDTFLNFAGMLAPIVAIIPTTDVAIPAISRVGTCWSRAPGRTPVNEDGTLANWVVANIDNNFSALLIVGVFGLIVMFVTSRLNGNDLETRLSLLITAPAIVLAWAASRYWSGFNTHAHGISAIAMFAMLALAVASVAVQHGQQYASDKRRIDLRRSRYYWVIAGAMVIGFLVIISSRMFGDHTIFALEIYEIALFAIYWGFQTVDRWRERVVDTSEDAMAASTR